MREIRLGHHKRVNQILIDAPVQVRGSDGEIPKARWFYQCQDCGASSNEGTVLSSSLWCSTRLDRVIQMAKARTDRVRVAYRAWQEGVGLL